MAARALVALVAVVAVAWLAAMERDARLLARGQAAAQAGEVASAEADFRAAGWLNPDSAPEIGRAFVLQGSGRPDEAAAVLEGVLEREPDNITAWGLLYAFSRERDPETAERALAARRRLDPLNARPD
jgi:predicted Zn-dependent protease